MRLATLLALAALSAQPASAQLVSPNDAGVTMGHLHLVVRDLEAQRQFWSTLGGTPVTNGPLQLIQFPGTFVMLREGTPSGGTAGSVINHIGFYVKSVTDSVAAWRALGLHPEPGTELDAQAWFTTPDGVLVEILEDASVTESIRMDHVHFNTDTADIPEIQAWYASTFGARPRPRAHFASADVPGVNLIFGDGRGTTMPSRGRALDHIGFEVANLDAFCESLEAQGVSLDVAPRQVRDAKTRIAFLTDPWGTYIELTEHLAP